ncbi:unnamed protein product, partial [Heterosigma akashiwo]
GGAAAGGTAEHAVQLQAGKLAGVGPVFVGREPGRMALHQEIAQGLAPRPARRGRS